MFVASGFFFRDWTSFFVQIASSVICVLQMQNVRDTAGNDSAS